MTLTMLDRALLIEITVIRLQVGQIRKVIIENVINYHSTTAGGIGKISWSAGSRSLGCGRTGATLICRVRPWYSPVEV